MREEIQDRYGNAIYMTDERWEHILENHSELEEFRGEVLSTVRTGTRTQDPFDLETFYYRKKFVALHEDFDTIEVVVYFRWQFNAPNNFVMTAYPV